MEERVIEKLDELIAATKANRVPADMRWIDADEAAATVSFTLRYFTSSVACRTDFPKPLRLDGTGHPRWLMSEVQAWAKAHRDLPKAGRPRRGAS